MLNPSTADCTDNDPTISRCVNMAMSWGYGGIEVVNLFAYRSTKPRELWQVEDPVGGHNDVHIKRSAAHSEACVIAWGNLPIARMERAKQVLKLLSGKKMFCLGMTKLNQPRHPLYLSNSVQLEQFAVAFGRASVGIYQGNPGDFQNGIL